MKDKRIYKIIGKLIENDIPFHFDEEYHAVLSIYDGGDCEMLWGINDGIFSYWCNNQRGFEMAFPSGRDEFDALDHLIRIIKNVEKLHEIK